MLYRWTRYYYLRFFYVLTGFILLSCNSSKIISADKLKFKRDFCIPPLSQSYNAISQPVRNSDSIIANNGSLARFITKQDILIANATGALSLIDKMIHAPADSSVTGQLIGLQYNQQIQKLLLPLSAEIESISDELNCEASRIRQLSSYIATLNSKRNTKLTVGAILAGAVSTIVPVFVTSNVPQNIILISSGATAAGLGLLTLNPRGKEVRLMHDRNLLEDIWFLPKTSTFYSPALWYILTEPGLSNTPPLSKAQIVRTRWLKFELDSTIDKKQEELLFRNGGIYNQAKLDLRVTMLDELQATVRSVNQNLLNFVLDVNRISTKND